MRFTDDEIRRLEYYRELEKDGVTYTYKDYMYKSEVRDGDKLVARINNRLPVDSPERVEYV